MASLRTKFSVGLFVIIGMAVVIGMVLWLGMSQFFETGRKYTAYFNESVQGLNKDSAVKYRGVDVGKVESISVAPDGRLVQVVFFTYEPLKNPEEMVAQLKSIGITGIMFIELERVPRGKKASAPKLEFSPPYTVIATRPSEIKKFFEDLYGILARLRQVDIDGISRKLENLLDTLSDIATNAEIEKTSHEIRSAASSAARLFSSRKWEQLQKQMLRLSESLDALVRKSDDTIETLDKAIMDKNRKIDQAIATFNESVKKAADAFHKTGILAQTATDRIISYDPELAKAIAELAEASQHLNSLLETLERNPSAMLYGTTPVE